MWRDPDDFDEYMPDKGKKGFRDGFKGLTSLPSDAIFSKATSASIGVRVEWIWS
jgi:hypothetical protein